MKLVGTNSFKLNHGSLLNLVEFALNKQGFASTTIKVIELIPSENGNFGDVTIVFTTETIDGDENEDNTKINLNSVIINAYRLSQLEYAERKLRELETLREDTKDIKINLDNEVKE